jgi:signal peptidase I
MRHIRLSEETGHPRPASSGRQAQRAFDARSQSAPGVRQSQLAFDALGSQSVSSTRDAQAASRSDQPRPSSGVVLPTLGEVDAEIARVNRSQNRARHARTVVVVAAVVFAITVLLSIFAFPLFRIYGTSMQPTLSQGDVVLAVKSGDLATGDLIAFSYNNTTLTKRVIAGPGDWVDIDSAGAVSVNGVPLDESYLPPGAQALGQCDIALPYQVPDNQYFVMGDNRAASVDSRSQRMGCIPKAQVAGKLELRIWPLARFGAVGG